MARLLCVPCPECGRILESDEFEPNARGGARRATDYESCLRRCDDCGIGLSNSSTDDRERLAVLYRDPFDGLPDRLREGCEETLDQALNVRNRPAKRAKFASSNSEDRITWIVFRCLQMAGTLGGVLAQSGIRLDLAAAGEPALLLWGAAVPAGDVRAAELRQQLIEVCDRIGERPDSRSEPDVIADLGPAGLVLIEVKHKSKNDAKAETYRGWKTYLSATPAFEDAERVRRSSLYALARYWRIGWELARERPFTLVNLGPEALFAGKKGPALHEFQESLNWKAGRGFESLTWTRLWQAIPGADPWVQKYARESGLIPEG